MRRAILVVLDGMRRDSVTEADTPRLAAFARAATRFTNHRSVFPSVTRVAAASISTGCRPARHGLQGNSLALVEDGRLVVHDAGEPDFLQRKRKVTGRSLDVPTVAERVREFGGAIVFGNVSPGATYAQDPDGHGYVYNRAGSFGPARAALTGDARLDILADIAGDTHMTERFVRDALLGRRPALAQLWLCEPDQTQHVAPLGSPEHLDVLRQADANVGTVLDAVARLKAEGDDEILLVMGSDHGHQTIGEIIDVGAALVEAGLKDDEKSDDVIVVPNGMAALVYVDPERVGDRLAAIADFLSSRTWVERLYAGEGLRAAGLAPQHRLAFAIAMRADDAAVNAFGVPGSSVLAKPDDGTPEMLGLGYHGGLGGYEQSPFLMVQGEGFPAGVECRKRSSILDIAPTILMHLGLPADGMDGAPLQPRAGAPDTDDPDSKFAWLAAD